MLLDGRASPAAGEPEALLLLLNAHDGDLQFVLPAIAGKTGWRLLLDTHEPDLPGDQMDSMPAVAGPAYALRGRSVAVLMVEFETGTASPVAV